MSTKPKAYAALKTSLPTMAADAGVAGRAQNA
jgi:hypothetical protein